ncbi:MAG: enoyl-CoA hydratase/isomerase family protein [Crocinitomicaceae bacterium]|jgi:2-(1,2-epoxy-1,2-dihydrophenyl)acetyl-CoA isomerase|nr:enoyl-CoA hydratase/isomerase family protein [Crocinitomicaceae bacterium]
MEISFEISEGIAWIKLNRPEVYNAFNRSMALQMHACLTEAATAEEVRAVVITGNGKAFSAGQDLAEAVAPDGPGLERILKEHYNPIIRSIVSLEKPVIALVNGVAAGAGANIALACDVVIAHEDASFIQAFSKIGLIPDSGGTYFLPRLIGSQKALALMMTGDKVSAKEAEQMNMIFKAVPADSYETFTTDFVTQIASMPTKALALTKKAVQLSWFQSLDEQLDTELTLQVEAGNTADFNEGVQAFLEKRKPNFTGK